MLDGLPRSVISSTKRLQNNRETSRIFTKKQFHFKTKTFKVLLSIYLFLKCTERMPKVNTLLLYSLLGTSVLLYFNCDRASEVGPI